MISATGTMRNAALDGGTRQFDEAYWHMPVLAVIDRSAFVPTLFTDPTKQPVHAAAARTAIDTPYGWPIEYALLAGDANSDLRGLVSPPQTGASVRRFWTGWPERYDYVLVTHFGIRGNPAPDHLAPVHEGSFFDLYRVVTQPDGP